MTRSLLFPLLAGLLAAAAVHAASPGASAQTAPAATTDKPAVETADPKKGGDIKKKSTKKTEDKPSAPAGGKKE
jgi:hypothetical protein